MEGQPSTSIKASSLRLLIVAPSSSETPSAPVLRPFLEGLTGTKPSNEINSFAGYTSHTPLSLRTKYYSADVGIWCDDLPAAQQTHTLGDPERTVNVNLDTEEPAAAGKSENDPLTASTRVSGESSTGTLSEWKDQMTSFEAAEVRAVIGGLVLVLPVSPEQYSPSKLGQHASLVEVVHALREMVEDEGYGRDVASVVVLQATSSSVGEHILKGAVEGLEEACLSEKGILGWDFVTWAPDQEEKEAERNEYGERLGMQRVIEVLEGIDWTVAPSTMGGGGDDEAEFDLDDFDNIEADDGSGIVSTGMLGGTRLSGMDYELQREMMELKMSMLAGQDSDDDEEAAGSDPHTARPRTEDQDFQVEQLPGLMERVMAIREAGSEMSKAEREEFAKREIARIMREMG